MRTLLDDLKSLNRELSIYTEYGKLLEQRIERVFRRLETHITREGETDGESE